MTYAEKQEQEKAYKEYEKNLAERFATSEDGESKEWEYLNKSHQSMEVADQDEPNTDS